MAKNTHADHKNWAHCHHGECKGPALVKADKKAGECHADGVQDDTDLLANASLD